MEASHRKNVRSCVEHVCGLLQELGLGPGVGLGSGSESESGSWLGAGSDPGLGSVPESGFPLPLSAEHIRRSKFNDPWPSPFLLHALHVLVASAISASSASQGDLIRKKKDVEKNKDNQVGLIRSSGLAFSSSGDGGIRSFKKLICGGDEEESNKESCRNPNAKEGNAYGKRRKP